MMTVSSKPDPARRPLSRRRMLALLGWTAAGITAIASTGASAFPVLPYRKPSTTVEAAGWVSLRPDGMYELWSPRAEMGQGIAIGLRQIVADELETDPARVRCLSPDTALIAPARATVGSDSLKDYGPLVAQAAATLAVAVRRIAARHLGSTPDAVSLSGDRAVGPNGTAVALAALAADGPVLVDGETEAAVAPRFARADAAARHVGRPVPTDRIDTIVTADAPLYADDIRLPGMVYGAMIRPDGVDGVVEAVDDSACRAIPGYIGLIEVDGTYGLLAERRWALARAMAAVSVKETHDETVSTRSVMAAIDIDAGLDGGRLEHVPHGGAVDEDTAFDVDLRLDVPLAAHAAMEPRTAVARFTGDGGLELWTGTQDAFFVRNTVADDLGLDDEKVIVHNMRIGGAFGGRTLCFQELDAARLARAAGRPVHVQWSRRDEFRAAFHRPPSSHRIRASLDENGRIATWWHAFRSGHVIFTSAALGPVLRFATSFVADMGVARGSTPPYAAGTTRVEFEDVRLPVMTGPWRGLNAGPNCWAIETAIDQLARHAGQDPLDFRLANLPPEKARLADVLQRVAAMAGWRSRAASPGRSFGLACGVYKEMSYAAVVAEVDLSATPVKVVRLWCAHDCGLVVNPDQVRAQIEGNLVWGIGMALKEELVIEDGRIVAESHADYEMVRYSDVPALEIDLIDSTAAPTGAGETAIVAATAAVTNAIAAATGRPVTRLPYRG